MTRTSDVSLIHSGQVRKHLGTVEFPVWHVRGGTSTGLIIWEENAPSSDNEREELLRHLMGVPLEGKVARNNQITGLGRGIPTSNKVFFVRSEEQSDGKKRLISTFAQLSADKASIDWGVNCGNMSAAIPLWALDVGIIDAAESNPEIDIYNTNTNVLMTARVEYSPDAGFTETEIPGVNGQFPAIDLFLHTPAGTKTGKLLPTGNVSDVIHGIEVSCVDVAVPMVIIKASDLGKTGHEDISELSADAHLHQQLKDIWVEAGIRMELKNRQGRLMSREELADSETIPKVCLVAEPEHEGSHITARYFTPQKGHPSMAVTGGCCIAAACLIEGSIAWREAKRVGALCEAQDEFHIAIDNPAGTLNTIVVGNVKDGHFNIQSAAYNRSAQILLKGWVPLTNPSKSLEDALLSKIDPDL